MGIFSYYFGKAWVFRFCFDERRLGIAKER